MRKKGINIKKEMLFIFFAISPFFVIYSNPSFKEGLAFLQSDMAEKASLCFIDALKDEDYPKDIYLYLGLSYLKRGLYSQAIDAFARGKGLDEGNFHLYAFNIGNAFFAQNRFYDAEISYNEAISSTNPYAPALLNRANSRMKIQKYHLALVDYKEYLRLCPDDAQKEELKRMIELLEKMKMEEESTKEAILAEAMRRAEESMRQQQEEREKRLLEEINSSLPTADSAKSVSSGTEETIDYEEDSDLD